MEPPIGVMTRLGVRFVTFTSDVTFFIAFKYIWTPGHFSKKVNFSFG